jgi:pimeloyl-ACP methyl ester carboxylesterase
MMDREAPSILTHRGCELSYTVHGDGPPVVFIQGTGICGSAWLPQIDALSSHYRCLFFDNRGMGQSQPLGDRLTVEQMADDVCALMDAQGWNSAHIVGHSLGGLIAQCLALSAPQRVRSLSLLCTFARGAEVAGLTWEMFWHGLRSYLGTRRMRRHAFLEMVMPARILATANRDGLADRLATLFGHDLADQPPIVMKQLAAMRAYDATPHLGKLSSFPILIAIAAHDRIARPPLGRALAAAIPGARTVEFPDAAHGLCIQCASEINALLHEHLSGGEQKQTRS